MEEMRFAAELAREAGGMIRRERGEGPPERRYKRHRELVTAADLKADRLIRGRIAARYPDHLVISEESTPEAAGAPPPPGPAWIVDPIDGTVNYAHGHSQSAVSIAFARGGGVRAGAVHNPFTDETFTATAGGGAFLNGGPIRVSGETELDAALIATGFPYDKDGVGAAVERVRLILARCADIRRLGSAALDICWLAAGRLDGFYESLSLWDFAAARLIAGEAGAVCGHFGEVPEGTDPAFYGRDILIAGPALYPGLRELLAPTAGPAAGPRQADRDSRPTGN